MKVRDTKSGILVSDKTSSFELNDYALIGLPDGSLIFPEIFRRAIDYLHDFNNKVFNGNRIDWMKWKGEKEDDSVLVGEKFDVHFSDLLEQQNYVITLKMDMRELAFVER